MRVVESPGSLKRYRRTTWEYQRTYQTPLQDLPRFVGAVMAAISDVEAAVVVVEQIVFEPRYALASLAAKYSLPQHWNGNELAIEAHAPTEASELLHAMLSEWIDFVFVPAPQRFVVYADHDEFITFLAHRKGQLNRVVESLTAAGFAAVEYVRKF